MSPLLRWSLNPVAIELLVASAGLYLWAAGRLARAGSAFPSRRTAWFLSGLAVIAIALVSPVDSYSHLLLSVHMVQHLLLTMVAPPLLLLGAPVTLLLQAVSTRGRRRVLLPILHSTPVRVLASPLLGWLALAAVLWGSHFSPLYEASLRNSGVHALEHGLYLAAGLLYWSPVIGRDPSPARLSHPARILYVFLTMPQTTFLGLAIYSTNRVLYPYYATVRPHLASAVADQHLAGAMMWTSSMVLMLPALGWLLFDWMSRDEREAMRLDARLAGSRGVAGPS